jgi:signal transduction histidine kinase
MARFNRLWLSIRQVVTSIRFRLALWFTAILALVMLAFSIFIYTRQVNYLHSATLGRLENKIHQIQALERFSPLNEMQEQVQIPDIFLDAGPLIQGDEIMAVTDEHGLIVQKYGPIMDKDVNQIATLTLGQAGRNTSFSYSLINAKAVGAGIPQEYTFLVAPISFASHVVGYLILGDPVDADGQLHRLLLTLVFGGLGTIILAQIGGYWLADRAMHPVKTITQAARQIGETDLSRRLNLGSHDELGQLANTFDEMLDRLQAAFDRQRQFTADASHELRTPLTIVGIEAGRTLSSPRKAAEYRQALGLIRSENEYMSRLVNNLLTLSRMDAGQTVLKMEPLDLSDLALEVVERMAPIAKNRGVELSTGELPEIIVLGDRQYLSQMISNLVENGIKYSLAEGGKVHVETGVSAEMGAEIRASGYAWLRVTDNGAGIPAEHLPHLFDRFYQVDAARSRDTDSQEQATASGSSGTGLGLSIVQWIVKAHSGEIHVRSQAGEGSIFEVRLPLR